MHKQILLVGLSSGKMGKSFPYFSVHPSPLLRPYSLSQTNFRISVHRIIYRCISRMCVRLRYPRLIFHTISSRVDKILSSLSILLQRVFLSRYLVWFTKPNTHFISRKRTSKITRHTGNYCCWNNGFYYVSKMSRENCI